MKSIVVGGGCFWCVEAVFQRVKGVYEVTSGYAGGTEKDPSYYNHGSHAEVVKIDYDENIIELSTIIEMFFYTHDPTTLNRQGVDIGMSYRSIILSDEDEIKTVKQERDRAQNLWDDPIVTEIEVLDKFYPAEDDHQDFYINNKSPGYCQVVINPKIAKFDQKFSQYLK